MIPLAVSPQDDDESLTDSDRIVCSECGKVVEMDEAEQARWRYYSTGVGDLLPFCPECAHREFGHPAALSPEN